MRLKECLNNSMAYADHKYNAVFLSFLVGNQNTFIGFLSAIKVLSKLSYVLFLVMFEGT